MPERPIVRFGMGAYVGAIASLSVSFGLLALIAMIALALLFGFASHSDANYARCVAMGPDCSGSESLLGFLMIAGVSFVMGLAIGLQAIVRHRAIRHGPCQGAS